MSPAQPSRRTVVRTAAWSAPAVVLATGAAPAYAGSGPRVLTISGGSTYAAKVGVLSTPDVPAPYGVWEFDFVGVTITATGGPLAAGDLTLAVTFVPDAAHAGHDQLTHNAGGPSGWSGYAASGSGSSAAYSYLGAVVAGGTVSVPGGQYVASTDTSDLQQGTLMLTASAPGFQSASWSLAVPGGGDMTFFPGYTTIDEQPTTHRPAVNFYYPSVALARGGPTVPNTYLMMTIDFIPDADATGGNLIFNGAVGGNFSSPLNQPATELYWKGTRDFTSGSTIVVAGSATYILGTNPISTQHGTFVFRFTAPGYNQTIWRAHTP